MDRRGGQVRGPFLAGGDARVARQLGAAATPPPATDENVRDFIVEMERFTLGSFMYVFDLKPADASLKLLHWLQRGVIRTVDDSDDGMGYEYVPPPNTSPTSRPRGEFEVQRMIALWRDQNHITRRGEPIARTGRPMGSTGKAGRDKRLMKAGKMTQESRRRNR